MTDSNLHVIKNCQLSKKNKMERLGKVPNKTSDFPSALGTHLYILIQTNLTVKFLKSANCNCLENRRAH